MVHTYPLAEHIRLLDDPVQYSMEHVGYLQSPVPGTSEVGETVVAMAALSTVDMLVAVAASLKLDVVVLAAVEDRVECEGIVAMVLCCVVADCNGTASEVGGPALHSN